LIRAIFNESESLALPKGSTARHLHAIGSFRLGIRPLKTGLKLLRPFLRLSPHARLPIFRYRRCDQAEEDDCPKHAAIISSCVAKRQMPWQTQLWPRWALKTFSYLPIISESEKALDRAVNKLRHLVERHRFASSQKRG
jgi:hypothetical protein